MRNDNFFMKIFLWLILLVVFWDLTFFHNLCWGKVMKDIKVSSSGFSNMGFIPKKYTCDGENVSPEIVIENIPDATKSLVLINDDPDAPVGTWDHWILFNIPPSNKVVIPEGIKPEKEFGNGMRHGVNSWGRIGYGGPCPPSGVHRYFFKVYALDITLNLPPGSTKKDILKAMENHVLGYGELVGKYSRQR